MFCGAGKKIIFFIFICLSLNISIISDPASEEYLTKDQVRVVMEELFSYHVSQQHISKELISRSFKIYIEQFDPHHVYLLEEEVRPYLNPTDSMLQDAVVRYQNDDLFYYEALNRLIQKSIIRARKSRKEVRSSVESQVDQSKLPGQFPKNWAQFATNENELKSRQELLMLYSILQQEQSDPNKANQQEIKQMFAFYEATTREFEDLYLAENIEIEGSLGQNNHFLVLHTLKSLARSLDAHSNYFSPNEARAMQMMLKKGFSGIGVTLQRDYRGITVRRIIANSPADESGQIFVGDKLIKINGKQVDKLTFQEVLKQLRGKNGSKVKLVVQSPNSDKERRVTLKRGAVSIANQLIETSYEAFGDGIIGKITLYAFYDNQKGQSSAEDIKKAIFTLKQKGKLKGLVLDLRENTGGFLNQAVEVAGLFISNGVIVMSEFADGRLVYFRDVDGWTYYNGPLVVLTSKLSASAAEIVAGTLQDYGVGLVVGDQRTFGKGTMQYQTITQENTKAYFTVTVGRYYTVSGNSTQFDGVSADILVPSIYSEEEIGEEYLDYALNSESVQSAYNDSLGDLNSRGKEVFLRYYIPTLQKQKTTWINMLPQLRANSEKRLKNNRNFQIFLKEVHGKEVVKSEKVLSSFETKQENYGAEDLQMDEAVNIVKDMVILNKNSSVQKVSSSYR